MPRKPGRPRREDKYGGHIAAAEGRIADRLPSLIDNMLALADGVTVQVTNDDGTTDVYTRPPDRQANEYLINRILGKPTEAVELSGPDGGSIPLSIEDAIGRIYGAEPEPEPAE